MDQLDLVRPEVYWINDRFGLRCYCRNVPSFSAAVVEEQQDIKFLQPSNGSENSVHLRLAKCGALFTDHDEPPCGTVDEEDDDYEIVYNDKYDSWCTHVTIAKEYFKHIIGRQAETKKRLESQTRTRVEVPKIGQSGDVAINGHTRANVASCRRRIEMLVDAARQRQPYTHFLSLPFNSDEIKKNFEDFKKSVLEECPDSRGLDASIFQKAECLHLTIGMLVLLSNAERTLAKETLERCKEDVIIPHLEGVKKPLKARLENLNYMNDDPSEVHILYGDVALLDGCDLDVLQSLADKMVEYFVQQNVMPKKQYEAVKLHVTLLNTRYRSNEDDESEANGNGANKSGGFYDRNGENKNLDNHSKRESFDARQVLEKFRHYDFGEQVLTEVHISQRHARRSDGYYSSTASIELY